MKFIRFFIAAAVAFFSLQFSTASAATPVTTAGTSLHAANSAPQRHVRHRARHLRRIHRHKR
ncbi:MAG: hypothetical protein ACXVJB_09355 [Mucilaginibacter sp.]